MAVEYCEYCDQFVDLDYCVEHFPEEYWETTGKDAGKCQNKLDDEAEIQPNDVTKTSRVP